MMTCPACGTTNSADSRFCKNCGQGLASAQTPTPTLSPVEHNGHNREQIVQVVGLLGGQNCGRCGYRTCAENAAAIIRGESPADSCVQAGSENAKRIRAILGHGERLSLGSLLWEQLTSIKLAIVLIGLIVALSIIGTLIPQNKDPFFYAERYGMTGLNVITFFQVDNLFHSWYFLTLLVLLCANTLACATKRFRVSWDMVRRPVEARSPEEIAELPGHAELPYQAASFSILEKVLARHRYRLEKSPTQLWARKHLWGRLGIDLLHVSLIVVLIGGVVGGLGGFEDFQVAHKGETFKVARGGFDVRIDDLWSSSYKGSSQIKDWYTKLTILDHGREVMTKTIEVNSPVTYNGISLYQASFGSDWLSKAQLTFKVERSTANTPETQTNNPSNPTVPPTEPSKPATATTPTKPTASAPQAQEITVEVGSEFPLDDGQRKVRVAAFYPDLVMGEQGPVNRSQRLNNPAAYLEVYRADKPDKPEFTTWTFSQFPEFQHEFAKGNPYRFFLAGMKAPEFTGLQIAHNPGIGLIYFGFAVMMLGLCLNFYLPPRRVWAAVKNNRLYLGGLGRDVREFEPELEAIAQEYDRAIQQEIVPPANQTKELLETHR